MSAIKNFYAEEINDQPQMEDADFQYEQWLEDKHIEERAEEAEFFRVFEVSGRYPM